MTMQQITRRQVLIGVGGAGALGALAPTAALAGDNGRGKLVRWDLVQVAGGVVLIGGTDDGLDSATSDVVHLTGSGQAEPATGEAAGGGTFLHQHSDETEVAHGVYVVTGFNSFQNAGGNLAPTGLADGIGEIGETAAGKLSLKVHLVASSGKSLDGVLTVNCNLPGAGFKIEEGITLSVGPFHFTQAGGFTVFHVLRGDEN